MLPAIDDQLGSRPLGADVGRAPGGRVIPPRTPDFLPIGKVESRDKSIRQHVALHEHAVAVNDRRTGESPFQVRAFGIRHVVIDCRTDSQCSQIPLPAAMAVQVVTIQPFGAKERDHVRAVGGHGAIGVRGLGMAL